MQDPNINPVSPTQRTQAEPAQAFGDRTSQMNATKEAIQLGKKIQQLEEILEIAQSLQNQQIQKQRESYQAPNHLQNVPAGASVEHVKSAALLDALEPTVYTQMSHLKETITTLMGALPNHQQLSGFLKQLSSMEQNFPSLSKEQLANLTSMHSELYKISENAPSDARAQYWQHQLNMLSQLMQIANTKKQAYTEQLQSGEKSGNVPAGLTEANKTLGDFDERYGQAGLYSTHKSVGSGGGVQHQISKIVINKYMPEQEKYLMELASFLSFLNEATNMGNSLLTGIEGLNQAASTYDLSSYMNSNYDNTTGDYNVSVSQMKNQITNEKNSVTKQEKQITNEESSVTKDINNLQNQINSGQLTGQAAKSAEQLIKTLKTTLTNLKGAYTNLQGLMFALNNITVNSVPGNKKACAITGKNPGSWQGYLKLAEGQVINGTTTDPGTGLISIYGKVQSGIQQYYSNLSQQQQSMLQMRMTEMQMQWSMVSTILQTANTAIQGCAKGILGQ